MLAYDVLIADDSERARKAVRIILNSNPLFQVVAEAINGYEAINKAKEYVPDLALIDIHMPLMDGLEATRIIKQELPHIRVVILSVSHDAVDLFEAIRSGAQGYLVKSLQPSDWITYLREVLNGEAPISSNIAEKLLAEFNPSSPVKTIPIDPFVKLTYREQEILRLVSTGTTNRNIAEQLFLSENTVKNHLKNMMAKLQVQNRVQLAIYAKNIDEHLSQK